MTGAFEWRENGPIDRAVDALMAASSADSEINRRFRDRLLKIVEADNARKLNQSIDRFGKPLAKLADYTRENRPRPGDRPLDPPNSSFRVKFKARWNTSGQRWILVASYDFPHAHFHVTGTRKMPARDTTGLSPEGKEEVQAALKDYAAEIRKSMTIGGRFRSLAKHILGGR